MKEYALDTVADRSHEFNLSFKRCISSARFLPTIRMKLAEADLIWQGSGSVGQSVLANNIHQRLIAKARKEAKARKKHNERIRARFGHR